MCLPRGRCCTPTVHRLCESEARCAGADTGQGDRHLCRSMTGKAGPREILNNPDLVMPATGRARRTGHSVDLLAIRLRSEQIIEQQPVETGHSPKGFASALPCPTPPQVRPPYAAARAARPARPR